MLDEFIKWKSVTNLCFVCGEIDWYVLAFQLAKLHYVAFGFGRKLYLEF
jgi:hypothetical protein